MQSNPNIDDKRTIEVWDWADTGHTDNAWLKKYNRRLRRKKLKRRIEKELKKE
jgi:hypothetical protein